MKKVQPKLDAFSEKILNLPSPPELKIDKNWQEKIDALMKKGEEMENDPIQIVTVTCSECNKSFVTESYKEYLKHKRMHKRYSQIDNSHLRRHLKRKCRDKPDSLNEVIWKKVLAEAAEAKEESNT